MTLPEYRTEHVVSADGTRIGVHRMGEGVPLLLVHGAFSDHSTWDVLAPLLSGRRQVMAIDRRGRGASGDAEEYRSEREVDDLFAAVMGLHQDVDVLAHSSGAIVALRAAERGLPVRRLVLYEPPLLTFRDALSLEDGMIEQLRSMVVAGERDAATEVFLRHAARIEDGAIERLRSTPRWQAMVAIAHTFAYDAQVAADYVLERRRLSAVKAPVLLLLGGESPSWMREATEALAAGLPDARVVELPRQGHNAMFSAPQLMADEVLAFLDGAAES